MRFYSIYRVVLNFTSRIKFLSISNGWALWLYHFHAYKYHECYLKVEKYSTCRRVVTTYGDQMVIPIILLIPK